MHNYPDGLPVVTLATAVKLGLGVALLGLLFLDAAQKCCNPRTSKTTRWGIGIARILNPIVFFLFLIVVTQPLLAIFFTSIGNYSPYSDAGALLEIGCQLQFEATVVPIFLVIPIVFILLGYGSNGMRVWTRWSLGKSLQKEMQDTTTPFASTILNNNNPALSPAAASTSDSGIAPPIRVVVLTVFRGAFLTPIVTALRNVNTSGRRLEIVAMDSWGTALSPETDEWARRNAELEGIADCTTFKHFDFVSPLPYDDGAVDMILIPLARSLPFAVDQTMSEAKKQELTDRLFADCARVLKKGGLFAMMTSKWFESPKFVKRLSEQTLSLPAGASNPTAAVAAGTDAATSRAKRVAAAAAATVARTAAVAFTGVHKRAENLWISFMPFELTVAYRSTHSLPSTSPTSGSSATAGGSLSRPVSLVEHAKLVTAAQHLTAPSPPPLPWFPKGSMWRLRDLYVSLLALFYCVLTLIVAIAWDNVGQLPSFVSWGSTVGALLLSCVNTAPVQLWAVGNELTGCCKAIRQEELDAAWEDLQRRAKDEFHRRQQKAGASRQGSSIVAVLPVAAAATPAFAGVEDEAAATSKAPLLSSEAASSATATSAAIARLSLARQTSIQRLSLRNMAGATAGGDSSLIAALPTQSVFRRVTMAYLRALRTVFLALTVYQLVTWLPGFIGSALLIYKFGMDPDTANRIVTISTIVLLGLIPAVGKRLYARYQARKEAQRKAQEEAEERAEALREEEEAAEAEEEAAEAGKAAAGGGVVVVASPATTTAAATSAAAVGTEGVSLMP